MGIEIERKYTVSGDAWRTGARRTRCRQGCLCVGPPVAVRVRIMGEAASVNVKRATLSLTRDEFEYAIPVADAAAMLADMCVGYPVDKTRHVLEYAGMRWEVDEFHGHNAGLIVAEIELASEDQEFEAPPWLGPEVSHDARYLNTHLTQKPYTMW